MTAETGGAPVVARFAAGVLVALAFMAGPLWAIPSPELVIGSVSSLSQVFALGAAMLGGGAALARSRSRSGTGTPVRSKTMMRAAIVLGLISCASFAMNFWQYSTAQNTRLARLQATLTRPAQFDGTQIQDKNLKEMSFTVQSENPLAMSTDQAAALLADARAGKASALFLDVRERGENLMGTLPLATHARFPDLQSAPIDMAGKQVVLFCHNGNRSSESCARLEAMGIDCRFIAGGIEKWIVEGREFSDPKVRGLSDLRAIPDYANRDVLLDTGQVKILAEQEGIQFLDVRYPGDFATQHLPGAINIPLRAMPMAELSQALAALPPKPFVAACYDRRSCFISQVLGLELTERGHDYRGRYTVPWEYFIPSPPKPHVAAWLAERNLTLWQRATDKLAAGLLWVADRSHILAAVLLLAVVSRLLVLPIALKAERDQIIMARVKPELTRLRQQLKSDPVRMTRAISQFYSRHGLTPVRNLAALVFLPLMMLGLAAVQQASVDVAGGFLWVKSGALPDPRYLLPAVFAGLGGVYFHLALTSTMRQRAALWTIGAPLLFALVFRLTALGNLYLCVALVLLLMQRWFVTGAARRLRQGLGVKITDWRIAHLNQAIIPLKSQAQLMGCGNKVMRLSALLCAGIDVPGGVVLNHAFLCRFCAADTALRTRLLDRVWTLAGARAVAVRSSGATEDGGSHSFAGVFDSELWVDRRGLGSAIDRVVGSFSADRVGSYAGAQYTGLAYNILIQQMVNADFSGVLFTRDPKAAGMMVLEYVKGTADDLVSGRVTPQIVRIGRRTGVVGGQVDCPVDLQALRRIGMRAEELFGHPQDIEWSSEKGRIRLVQSRDITTLGKGGTTEHTVFTEWQRLADRYAVPDAQQVVLEMDEMSEVLPRPTALSLSYMQEIWAPGGSVDLACRRLGLRYGATEREGSHLTTVFGRLYSDVASKSRNAVVLNAGAVRRLERAGDQIEADYRRDFLPEYYRKLHIWGAVEFTRLDPEVLQEQLRGIYQDFLHWTHAEIETINIAAQYFTDSAVSACDATGVCARELLSGDVSFSLSGLLRQAAQLPVADRRGWLQRQMGHRSVFDYELSEPRYSEVPGSLDLLLRPALVTAAPETPVKTGPSADPALSHLLERARRYQALKEEAKHHALRHLAVIRRAVVALDRHMGGEGLVFYLTFEELLDEEFQTRQRIATARRCRDWHRLLAKTPALAARLTLAELELATGSSGGGAATAAAGQATWVSGDGPVVGRAYMVTAEIADNGGPLEGFADGDILICTMVHPAWLPHVLTASAVVSEVGGWLSHMAIVARECGVPMLVGATGLAAIETGTLIRVAADGITAQEARDLPACVKHIAE